MESNQLPQIQIKFHINPNRQKVYLGPKECPFCHSPLKPTPPNQDWIPLISGMYVKGKKCTNCNTICHIGMDLPISNRQKELVVKHFYTKNHLPVTDFTTDKNEVKKIDTIEELLSFVCLRFKEAKASAHSTILTITGKDKLSFTYRRGQS